MIKEHPIIFSSPMIRALLENRKSQTRRPINPQPIFVGDESPLVQKFGHKLIAIQASKCPYGQLGDRLWVKETWTSTWDKGSEIFLYRATDEEYVSGAINFKWSGSRFMPKRARITLEIVNVRVERLQEITRSDIRQEGLICPKELCSDDISPNYKDWYPATFKKLWDSIYSKKGMGWTVNPWVWIITFRRLP